MLNSTFAFTLISSIDWMHSVLNDGSVSVFCPARPCPLPCNQWPSNRLAGATGTCLQFTTSRSFRKHRVICFYRLNVQETEQTRHDLSHLSCSDAHRFRRYSYSCAYVSVSVPSCNVILRMIMLWKACVDLTIVFSTIGFLSTSIKYFVIMPFKALHILSLY